MTTLHSCGSKFARTSAARASVSRWRDFKLDRHGNVKGSEDSAGGYRARTVDLLIPPSAVADDGSGNDSSAAQRFIQR